MCGCVRVCVVSVRISRAARAVLLIRRSRYMPRVRGRDQGGAMPFSTAGGAGSEALLAGEPPPLAGESGPIKFPAHVERSSKIGRVEFS